MKNLNKIEKCVLFFIIICLMILFAAFIYKIELVILESDGNYSYNVSSKPLAETDINNIENLYMFISAPKIMTEPISTVEEFNNIEPTISATVGDTIVYLVTYYNIDVVALNERCVALRNFTGNVSVVPVTDQKNKYLLIVSDIKAPYTSENINIDITGGTGITTDGTFANSYSSPVIRIYQKVFHRLAIWILSESEALIAFLGTIVALFLGLHKIKNEKTKS